jgi:JmjC domain, hydroxylase
MRIIFLSIEFSIGTFSGNGIYAISQVRAIRQLGHQVLIICGRPAALSHFTTAAAATDDANLLSIPLPVWSRLDLECSWKEYAQGCGAPAIVKAVVNFEADVVLGVDWHSYLANKNLSEALEAEIICSSSSSPSKIRLPPYACSNYRVYLRSLSDTDKDYKVLRNLEGDSLLQGICAFVLSASDKNFVENNYHNFSNPLLASSQLQPPPPPVHVILPALRADLAALPLPSDIKPTEEPKQQEQQKERKFLLCCVRASPEKEPHRFVNLICELQKRGFFNKYGVIPLIAGAGWKVTTSNNMNHLGFPTSPKPREHYILDLRHKIQSQVPCCQVIENFLGPIEMADIYSQTVLNIHPPLYDAYGMTVVEAASQLVPSLVAHKGHIGATDLLRPERKEIFVTDMEDTIENLANVVEHLFENGYGYGSGGGRELLKKVGEKAAVVARRWSEEANAAAVIKVLENSLKSISNGFEVLKKEDVLQEKAPFIKMTTRGGGIDVLIPATSSCSDNTSDEDLNAEMYKYFEENYLAANKPVIFSGLAANWRVTTEFVIVDSPPDRGSQCSINIDIDKLERKFGGSRVVATDSHPRHRGEGPCKEMSVAEYCQWWRERYANPTIKDGGSESGDGEHSEKNFLNKDTEEHLWYLKDWHFVKDALSPEIQEQQTNKRNYKNFYYYQLPIYFSDDWLNEWYDSLSTSTRTSPTSRTSSSACSSDYRFLYLGPQGSSTPLHTDVLQSHSFSANIAGRKLWRLLPAEYAYLIQDKNTGMSSTPAPQNQEESKQKLLMYTRFSGMKQAQQQDHIIEIVQYPHEVIFVPSGWYHTVHNLDDCLSINHNWISSHSVMTSWRYLKKERKRAEDLIEDCRGLENGVAEFELLVQRNVEMNAGLGYAKFGAMVRYIAMKACGAGENEHEGIANCTRLTAAEKILSELIEEQEKVFLVGVGGSSDDINETKGEKDAKEELLNEIRLNKECLEAITAALQESKK